MIHVTWDVGVHSGSFREAVEWLHEANAVGPNEPSKSKFPSFIQGYHAYMGTVGAYCR